MNVNTDTNELNNNINEKIENNNANIMKKLGHFFNVTIYVHFFKRIFDILGGIVGFIILIPLTIIVFFANLINKDKGPLFYSQKRIGKKGRVFKIYKFRSMIVGASDILKQYLDEHPDEKKEYTKYRKLKHDPRITKTGAFLRKTSLDEWPQFVNILKGDMSLVGNRPYLLREKEEMGEDFDSIEKYKPGLTGLWQTSGRSNLKFVDRINIEKEYVPTLVGDIKIICATVQKVLKRDGAV